MADPEQPKPKSNYLDQLYADRNYSQTEFDKSLILIASGLLAASFAFIDNIVKIDQAIYKGWLLCGWVLLGGAIGLSSICHFRSIVHIEKAITLYNVKDDPKQFGHRQSSSNEIAWLNILTIVFILIGSASIFLFIYLNFFPPCSHK